MAQKLDEVAKMEALSELEGWEQVDGRDAINRNFVFANFNAAFAFMTRVAMLAEKMDHHPEWANVYKHVDVVLTTHSADGVTELDVKMAKAMNRFAES